MGKIIRRIAGEPLSEEARQELRELLPDSEINTVDIPETTPEQFARMRARRKVQREQQTLPHQKAS